MGRGDEFHNQRLLWYGALSKDANSRSNWPAPQMETEHQGHTISVHPQGVVAFSPTGDWVVGRMRTHSANDPREPDAVEIGDIRVAPGSKRKGVATAMLEASRQIRPTRHSSLRTPSGDKWAKARP
jgi:hypothetical protein